VVSINFSDCFILLNFITVIITSYQCFSGNPKLHINAINKKCIAKACEGEPSLQNALTLAANSLRLVIL